MEAVAAAEAHMLIGLGWIDGWVKEKVFYF